MPVVFLIAVVAVLVGVFFAATGRGGELAIEHADHAPLDLGPVSAADIALLRPPTTAWGYNMQVTDEALDHIARAMRDRDVTIARLRQQLLNRDLMEPVVRPAGAPVTQADARRPLEVPGDLTAPQPFAVARGPSAPQPLATSTDTDVPQPQAVPSDSEDTQTLSFRKPPGILVASRSQDATLPRRAVQPPEVTQPGEVAQSDEITQPHQVTPPGEVAQPREATQPTEATPPPQATQPTKINQPSDVTRGPQGSYDTHDWWAAEQGAAQQGARRPAEAQPATEPGPAEPDAPSASAPAAGSPRPATPADAPSAAEEQGW